MAARSKSGSAATRKASTPAKGRSSAVSRTAKAADGSSAEGKKRKRAAGDVTADDVDEVDQELHSDQNGGDDHAEENGAAEDAEEDEGEVSVELVKPAKKTKTTRGTKAKSAPRKPRKVRTLADKRAENAPMEKPFYVETGSEWHGSNVDFDELRELRQMWELPAACHILWLLQQPLTLRFSNTLIEYERALLHPETSTILEDVFTKLLLKKSERDCLAPGIGLKYEWWSKQLREYYMDMYDRWEALLRKAGERVHHTSSSSFLDSESSSSDEGDDDEERDVELSDDEWLTLEILKSRLEGLGTECPLKHVAYADLPLVLRCRILLNLCEAVVDDPQNTDFIRQMEEDDLRVEPLGRDRVGNWYYFFPQFYEERRIYRLEMETQTWDLWAKGDDAFGAMLDAMRALRGRKARGEQELIDHLEVIMEQIEEDAVQRAKQLEKATKRAILEAIPRKRSLRIQVKQIEQIEKQQEEVEVKKQLSMEEIAELKRKELLRKVEQEAERETREKEREARRRAREEQEREAAIAERELRRQKRLEKEKEDEEKAARLEEERKKQEEARKLRAMQRKAAEAGEGSTEEGDVEDVVSGATA